MLVVGVSEVDLMISPGEFIVNLHYYHSENHHQVPVTIYLAEVNPTLRVLHYATVTMTREGEEKTAVRFTILPDGRVSDINTLPKSIVEVDAI